MNRNRRNEEWIGRLLAALSPRAKSLLVTVFGDSILPHGGTAWLGSLIRLMQPLGLSERMVRTSVFRLAREGWLTAQPLGRRSYYSLSESGRARFDAADRRIYAAPRARWEGDWRLVFFGGGDLASDRREVLRRELIWQGFGQIAPGVLAHPEADREAVRQALNDMGASDQVLVLRAEADRLTSPQALRALARSAWDIDRLAAMYQGLLDHFRPLWHMLESSPHLDPEFCFLIRTLMVHDYRRIMLKDPLLPLDMLPTDWAGTSARLLCRNLYRLLQEPAERHLMQILETPDGPVPHADPAYANRFVGMPASEPAA